LNEGRRVLRTGAEDGPDYEGKERECLALGGREGDKRTGRWRERTPSLVVTLFRQLEDGAIGNVAILKSLTMVLEELVTGEVQDWWREFSGR
jgi:hypothetical protein